jgi:hypothetical protein
MPANAPVLAPLDARPASSPQKVEADVPALGSWILVANVISSNLSVLNTATGVVYGPLLDKQLGSDGGGRFDIAVTPDHKTALISNFGDSVVFLVDITNPISPSLITSVTLPFFAEDIAVSPDGKYALVTDGGFSTRVAAINTLSATLVYTADLGDTQAQAVAIAPDGTVLLADYWNQAVHSIRLDDMLGGITSTHTYTAPYPGVALTDTANLPRPVNVGVAPDGQTVIVCSAISGTVDIFRIVSPGVLTFTGVITGLEGTFPEKNDNFNPGVQSVAFNAAGNKAYAVVNGYRKNDITGTNPGDRLAVLNITGPGQVSLEAGGVLTLPHKTSSQYFGVDTVAVAGNKVYLGYPTGSTSDDPTSLAIVDLTDYSVTSTMVLSKAVSLPTGVAAVIPYQSFLPLVFKNYP